MAGKCCDSFVSRHKLIAIKLLPTVVWIFFVTCILLIPIAVWLNRPAWASALANHLIAFLYIEVYTLRMKLNATEVRRRILSLLDDLPPEGIVITKHGQPLARLTPIKRQHKGPYITGPLLEGRGKPGPLCPTTGNPYELLFD